jgi:hypothetical protein
VYAPLEYVTAIVEGHFSPYQGKVPDSEALPMDNVKILEAYPSQLQQSPFEPPLPDAHT